MTNCKKSLEKRKKDRVCPICGYQENILVQKSGEYSIFRCASCRLIYVDPLPSKEKHKAFHNQQYFYKYYQDSIENFYEGGSSLLERETQVKTRRLTYISRFCDKGRILDIGAGQGLFLVLAKEKGWDAFGTDVSSYTCDFLAGNKGIEMFNGYLEDSNFPSNYFDVITLWQVLEHTFDPYSTLLEAKRILKASGHLFLAVPNTVMFETTLRKVFRKPYFREDADEWHFYGFNPDALRQLLKNRLNFHIEHIGSEDDLGVNGFKLLNYQVSNLTARLFKIDIRKTIFIHAIKPTSLNVKTQRILYIVPLLAKAGAELHLVNLVNGLDKEKFKPTVCCIRELGSSAIILLKNKIDVISLGRKNIYDPRIILDIFKLIKKYRFDIVHSYLFGFDYSATIPAKLCGVPLIISSRRELAKWKKIHHRILGKLEFLTTDRIVSCSEAAKCFAAEDEGVYIEKIKTIYNGVNLKLFYPRPKDKKILEEFKLNEGGPVIGTVTKFVKVKDVETTLKAVVEICRAFCETKVLVIGGGEIEGNLKRKVLDLGLERNIIFTGFREDIPSLLSVMDVFMLSSLSEGLPNVILEAMASGLPVVATKVGGIPEVVVEGESGFLVQPRDFRNLAAAVIRFLENKELRFRMGSRGRMIAEERFALGKMVSDYETLYSVRKPKCPVCFYYKCAHMFQKQRNNFFRCNHCGLIFIWPQPDLGTINRMYEDWGKEYYLSLEKLDLAFNASFQERLDKIEPFRKNNRLLDIGCSTGAFLSAAQKRNWQAYGVEISLPSVEYARKNKKLDVFLGTLEEARYEDEYFDVIIAWAVLEHVPDPLRILKESQRILRKGGLLFFCVPNFNSLPIKLIGKKYRYIQEGHLFYFTKRSVSIMLEKSGFKLCRMTSEYFSPLSFIEDLRGIVPNTRETETRERNIVNKARNTKLHYLVVRPLWRTFMFIVRRMELGDELSVIALK